MQHKKQSSKDNSSSLKKKEKKTKRQDDRDQREDKPKYCGSGGKPGSKILKKDDKHKGSIPVHMNKNKALEGIAPSLVEAPFEMGECGHCGMDTHTWMFCRKSIVVSYCKCKWPKLKDYHPKDVSSAAGAAGSNPKAQVSASRRIYKADSNNEMIIDCEG